MRVNGSNAAIWTYDLRGRVLTETKTITGGGSFVTAWDHNSADLLLVRDIFERIQEGIGVTED